MANMVMDAQVVERLRRHEETAFQALFERLQQPLTGYLHRLVGEREVALDLAQDTFLQVYKEIGRTSGDLKLDAWIYRIATNYGLRYLNRKRLKQFIHLDSHELPDSALAMPGPEEQALTRVLVQQALGHMNPKDAAIVELHFGNGFTYEEIGQILQISAEAVRKRVGRSAEKFRALYDESPVAPADSVETRLVAQKKRW
ncbi:MAG TPA: RNA polymerase sigma factor [Ktedonobacteraceae bacterium]|nr:RNA polymerase sigma factor [Ktedonobacteraceae bacterium]